MNEQRKVIEIVPEHTSSNSRRQFIRGVIALSGAGVMSRSASAAQDYWEEGDPKCRAPDTLSIQVPDPTADQLAEFIALSEAVTGFAISDRALALDYWKRFSSHPRTSVAFPALVNAFREAHSKRGPDFDEQLRAKLLSDDVLKFGTTQLIYLWYIAALAIADDKGQLTWIYDEVDQFEDALVWKAVDAHAPMVAGGPRRYWKDKP
jgi:hypothetical protein